MLGANMSPEKRTRGWRSALDLTAVRKRAAPPTGSICKSNDDILESERRGRTANWLHLQKQRRHFREREEAAPPTGSISKRNDDILERENGPHRPLTPSAKETTTF